MGGMMGGRSGHGRRMGQGPWRPGPMGNQGPWAITRPAPAAIILSQNFHKRALLSRGPFFLPRVPWPNRPGKPHDRPMNAPVRFDTLPRFATR